jgi:hypothetical protein
LLSPLRSWSARSRIVVRSTAFVSFTVYCSLPARPMRRLACASTMVPRTGVPCLMTTSPSTTTSSTTANVTWLPSFSVADDSCSIVLTAIRVPSGSRAPAQAGDA